MKHLSENQSQEVIAGLVERVTYHNVENGFCVLRAKARGHRDVVRRTCPNYCSRRVDHGVRRMGQRSNTRTAVQGAVPAHIAADLGRRYREIPFVRHDPTRWPGLRQETPARVRRES